MGLAIGRLWLWLLSALVQKNLPEAKLKSYGLTALTEEISRPSSIDCVCLVMVAMLMWICDGEEQAEQGKLKNVQFEEKRSTRKCNGAKSSAQGDKKFKEKLDSTGRKRVLTSGQDSTQLASNF